jgi:hypothetical protein
LGVPFGTCPRKSLHEICDKPSPVELSLSLDESASTSLSADAFSATRPRHAAKTAIINTGGTNSFMFRAKSAVRSCRGDAREESHDEDSGASGIRLVTRREGSSTG